ncbi:MAG: hypothetical protein CMH16_12470 [Methylobacterium sp.]|nr:hypothetical protein [Methylobacterium sp.]
MVSARGLAAAVCQDRNRRPRSRRGEARRVPREGPPLGRWRNRGPWSQAIGRSRGVFTSKVHCLADGRGRPVAFTLRPGNMADITMSLPQLRAVVPAKRLIADKAYDAQSLRDWLKSHPVIATIPSTATQTVPYKHSRIAYLRRNRIERLFGHLKNWRRVATRYDRLACNYLAAGALGSCVIVST